MSDARVAADVGGTFTDVVGIDGSGRLTAAKVPSTPEGYERAVLRGVAETLTRGAIDTTLVGQVLHGTTVGTNAVLEHSGPATALVTTSGFQDVLEIGRLRTPTLYDLGWQKPPALVPRRLRLEVDERIAADGTVLRAPDLELLGPLLDDAIASGVVAVAICLINSYINPAHEDAVARFIADRHPGVIVTTSTEVSREIGEFERSSTAVVNAYLRPVVSTYLDSLVQGLDDLGIDAPLFVMQSSGGMMPASDAARLPAHLLESGPAAGVLAAARIARNLGIDQAISFDMGGTTAKASLIANGKVSRVGELSIGTEISATSRLLKGGGYTVRLPVLDLAEIGAGGGSISRVDLAGGLSVGPASAGADPGPACYGRGGTLATVTDANLVLGYVSTEYLRLSGVQAEVELARAAISRDVATPLGLSVIEAAIAIHRVADQQMARVLRAVSTERGLSLEDCSLIVFGGSGALHAASLAETVRIGEVVVPPFAGVLSALGMLWAPVELTKTETVLARLDHTTGDLVNSRIAELARDQRQRLVDAGIDRSTIALTLRADLRYLGQASELAVVVDGLEVNRATVEQMVKDFHSRHIATYGHGGQGEVEIVRYQVSAVAESPLTAVDYVAPARPTAKSRAARFATAHAEVPVVTRQDLIAGAEGPLFIDEPDTTIVVPPGWSATTGAGGEVVMRYLP